MTPPPAPFNSQEYWVARHQQFAGSHQATGMLGSSSQANRTLYDLRRRALLAALRRPDLTGARVLDAGCGLGDFSRVYSDRGAQVYGCDVSPLAIKYCRQHGPGRFACGQISDVPELFPGVEFDIVHCFDVLYHLTDDPEWRATLRVLDARSAPNAVWYLTEIVRPVPGPAHIRARQRQLYDPELARYGRQIAAERRLHWLLSVRPALHDRFPALSTCLEPLCRIWPTASKARVALWTIQQCPRGAAEGRP